MTTPADRLKKLGELREAASPGPWEADPQSMAGPKADWGVFHVDSGGQICYVGDPYPRGDNAPYENMQLIAQAPALAASVEALGAALEAYPGWSDDVEEADRLHWWRSAQDALASIPDLEPTTLKREGD